MQVFSAPIVKLGINACLNVPEKIVKSLLAAAGKKSAPVQVKCALNGVDFDANVVRYSGDWRLYLNLVTRRAAGCDIGDKVKIQLTYDPSSRMPPMPELFRQALRGNPDLQKAWRLRPTPHAVKFCNPSSIKRAMPNSRPASLKRLTFSLRSGENLAPIISLYLLSYS